MVFVKSTTPATRKTDPKTLSEDTYYLLAKTGSTIPEVVKTHKLNETSLRCYLLAKYPAINAMFIANQNAKYAPKPKKEIPYQHYGISEHYKKATKAYKSAIICKPCLFLLAHTNLDQIFINLTVCPKCNNPTQIEDIQSETYRKITHLKINSEGK